MRKALEDLYFGNITSSEKEMHPGSKLQRAVNTAAQCESQLAESLDETRQEEILLPIDFPRSTSPGSPHKSR